MYALGTFINAVVERTEHANTVDHSVVMALLKHSVRDGSPMVRRVSTGWGCSYTAVRPVVSVIITVTNSHNIIYANHTRS